MLCSHLIYKMRSTRWGVGVEACWFTFLFSFFWSPVRFFLSALVIVVSWFRVFRALFNRYLFRAFYYLFRAFANYAKGNLFPHLLSRAFAYFAVYLIGIYFALSRNTRKGTCSLTLTFCHFLFSHTCYANCAKGIVIFIIQCPCSGVADLEST